MREFQHVPGSNNKNKVEMYALSTCIWCRKTKRLLDELKVEYDYIDMDTVDDDVENEFHEKHANWNPSCSYPTLVINNEKCIVGFEEDEIRSILG